MGEYEKSEYVGSVKNDGKMNGKIDKKSSL